MTLASTALLWLTGRASRLVNRKSLVLLLFGALGLFFEAACLPDRKKFFLTKEHVCKWYEAIIHTGIYYEQAFSSTQFFNTFFHFLVKIALAARLSKCSVSLFFHVCAPKGGLEETMETGDKYCNMTYNIFKRCLAFLEQVGPQILSLESAVYFGTSEYFSGRKQKRISMSRSSAKLEANFSRIKALDFCVFNHAHSINSETNHWIRYKK